MRRVFLAVVLLCCAAFAQSPLREPLPPRPAVTDDAAPLFAMHAMPIAAAATCTEREPNETTAQATSTSVPSTCSGSAASTDASSVRITYESGSDGIEDVYVLTVPTPAQLTIELTYPSSTADLDLMLFNLTSSGAVRFLAVSNRDSAGAAERITGSNPLAAGTYYIGVSAFSGSSSYTLTITAPGYSDTCQPNATSVCLNNGRFRVETTYTTTGGESGSGQGVLMTNETGYFWFFNLTNVEVVVKLLDACPLNQRFWVFAGGLTDVNVRMRVTDTVTNVTKEYVNPQSTAFRPINDTDAFNTCSGTAPQCNFTVSPTSRQISSAAATGTIAVTAPAGCAWTATSNAAFITITSGASGSGNGSVGYSVAANTGSSVRTGTLTVAGQQVSIEQAGATASCTFTVSPTSQSFAAAGGSNSFTVNTQAGCAWTATTTTPWITVNTASGTGTGSVSYSVAAHSGTASRSGSISAGGRTFSVTQSGETAGCANLPVTFNNRTFTWCGGDATYVVQKPDGCSFSVSSSVPWIDPVLVTSPTGGTNGNGSFQVEPNTSSGSRTGTITIAGTSFTITQNARPGFGGEYDGMYSGTTNTNRAVTACVADNTIEMLRVTVRLDFTTFTCTVPLVRTTPMPINGSSYSGQIQIHPEVSNIFTTVNGSFPSNTSMSGSWNVFNQSYFVRCGTTVGVGTGGTSLAAGSFTATKQP